VFDMLSKTGMLKCKAIDALMEANIKLLPDQRDILNDPKVSSVSR